MQYRERDDKVIIFLVFLQFLFSYISTKIISQDFKLSFKELLYVLITGSFLGFTYNYINIITVLFLYIFLIFLWRNKSNIYEVLIYCSLGMIISVLSDHISSFFRYAIFGNKSSSFKQLLVLHMPMYYIIGLILSSLASYVLKRILANIKNQNKSPIFLTALSCFIWLTYVFSIILIRVSGDQPRLIILNLIFLSLYLILFFGILITYILISQKTYETRRREDEYMYMERYTQDIEKQYNELRKFRHDYQNILTSLEGYLVQEDTAGLKQYFYSNIKKHSDRLMHNEYMLEDLSNIKINGIKSIIATKIIYAQDMGLNANFETSDVITRINMDIILLVRILGILLDNAIEELLYLGYGQLLVGLIKYPDNILIIVQNTCRDNLPNIQTLKKRNFSTKSSNRGLGLSNVSDIIDQCPNVISEIIVDNQLFIHKIFIFDKEK